MRHAKSRQCEMHMSRFVYAAYRDIDCRDLSGLGGKVARL
jgi:hypothetical protein